MHATAVAFVGSLEEGEGGRGAVQGAFLLAGKGWPLTAHRTARCMRAKAQGAAVLFAHAARTYAALAAHAPRRHRAAADGGREAPRPLAGDLAPPTIRFSWRLWAYPAARVGKAGMRVDDPGNPIGTLAARPATHAPLIGEHHGDCRPIVLLEILGSGPLPGQ